jgi:hypothetical protein
MNRTTIVLPDDIKAAALKRAQAEGVSFGSLVREALGKLLREPSQNAARRSRRQAVAALLEFGHHAPAGPTDLSERLDDYLYGPPKSRRAS